MSIYYPPDQTEAQRAEEIRKFKFVCPEYFDTPENLAVLKQYLSASSLPILTDTLCAGFLLNRNNLVKKPTKLRLDDSNAPGRTGRATIAEKQAENDRVAKEQADLKAKVNNVVKQRERREAEANIAQHREYRAGRIDWAKTREEQQKMTAELDRTNPRQQ
jgi:hypothetical protein